MPLQVLTEDKHADSFPTSSEGLICILPEKEKEKDARVVVSQLCAGENVASIY